MDIRITGQGLEVTSAIEKYVTKRLHGLDRRSARDNDHIAVVLSTEGDRSHVKVHAMFGRDVYDIHTESHDMYVAVDEAKHKLHRMIEDRHDVTIERKRRG